MTPFQLLSVVILCTLFAREVIGMWRGPLLIGSKGLRIVVWLAAAIAIARPEFVQRLAELAGIDRGADFVFYLFVLAFLGVSFYFYSRFVRVQRQMTQLIRQIAIQEARQGTNEPALTQPG